MGACGVWAVARATGNAIARIAVRVFISSSEGLVGRRGRIRQFYRANPNVSPWKNSIVTKERDVAGEIA
jgi:hypothetical protein